ncbi:acyl transferase domain-containing protein, partial [Paenibacillus forsythiae]
MNDKHFESLLEKVENHQLSIDEAILEMQKIDVGLDAGETPLSGAENDPEKYVYNEAFLKDHKIDDEQVVLGVTCASLAINAFFKRFPTMQSVELQNLLFIHPITLKPNEVVEVSTDCVQRDGEIDFRTMYRKPGQMERSAAEGKLLHSFFDGGRIDLEAIKLDLDEYHDLEDIYSNNPAMKLGHSFKTITRLLKGKNRTLARVGLRLTPEEEGHCYDLHPHLINAAFLAMLPLAGDALKWEGFLPFGVKRILFRKNLRKDDCWVQVDVVRCSDEIIVFDADLINDKSEIVARFIQCSVKRIRGAVVSETDQIHQMERNERLPADLSDGIRQYLIRKIQGILPDEIFPHHTDRNFLELGLDSSTLISLTLEIEKETGIGLNPTLFFEYPSITELSAYFNRSHADSFRPLLGTTARNLGVDGRKSPNRDSSNSQMVQSVQSMKPEAVQNTNDQAVHRDLQEHEDDGGIAIIGIHGLFPESDDLDHFWENILDKKNMIKEIPSDHWDYRPWFDENQGVSDKTYCKWGSFLSNVDRFDAEFFNISRREAEWIDPQIRLLLQSIYATAEDAGYIKKLRGSQTGVFVGACVHDYADRMAEMNLPVDPYAGTGTAQTVIANRISFVFDLKGPSMAVDTACSSSLFALHLACQALKNEECEMAFVGGVNLLLSSWHYRYFSSIGALSPTGRCHTFKAEADGYVPGEAISSILLKPLAQAEKDGDRIYAVIKGSAALHGGYTPSLTAPSVIGEENVILKAWANAGIEPETISYIEAHGTGTKLGDPIEINSVNKAFRRFTDKEGFCAIGSVKSNIGHTEGAAGLAGIMKIILQMKDRKIPAMPKFETLNPYIRLDQSALYINRENQEWVSPPGVPRRAGISSFGFSGSYAHVVVEEYVPANSGNERPVFSDPALFLLSAKSEERLRARLSDLLLAVRKGRYSDRDLIDMAYTLQMGREEMEYRLGFTVRTIAELESKLEAFLEGGEAAVGLVHGCTESSTENLSLFSGDEDLKEMVSKWLTQGKYAKVLDLWVKGMEMDWSALYENLQPRIIGLPTYPFAGERYWLPEQERKTSVTPMADVNFLHPLVHLNTSNLSELRFSTTFTGDEFYLVDHQVKGERVLPGVAYLEMARMAAELASKGKMPSDSGIRLTNVVWLQPIVAGKRPVLVHIGLVPGPDDTIAYEIYSEIPGNAAQAIVHGQGTVVPGFDDPVPALDLGALQAQCSLDNITAGQCYDAFKSMGIVYGPSHSGIERLFTGENIVLAKLSLPPFLQGSIDSYILHPCLMDSAFQAAIGLLLGEQTTVNEMLGHQPYLPFALDELRIFGACGPDMWAFIRYSNGSRPEDKLQRLDIDLSDSSGRVCVHMRGFSSRVMDGEMPTVSIVTQVESGERSLNDVLPSAANMQKYLIRTVSNLCTVDSSEIDPEVDFDEYGLSPIKLAELTNRLNESIGLNLKSSSFFGLSTLKDISSFLLNLYPKKMHSSFFGTRADEFTEGFREADTATDLPIRLSNMNYDMNVMDELLGRMLLSQLQTLGLAGNGSLDELREKAGLPAQYHKWLKESLIVLAQREYLRYDGQVVRLNGSGSSGTQGVWEEWERKKTQWLNDPDMKAQAVLVEATLRALPDILTGRTPATDIMFPNASMELVEGIYKQNRMADAF